MVWPFKEILSWPAIFWNQQHAIIDRYMIQRYEKILNIYLI